MNQALRILRDLVAIPSVNPDFAPGRKEGTGENQVAQQVAATARALGLEVEVQPVLPERPNVLARLAPPARPARRILLAAHMDTVNGTPEQFRPRQKDNRLYGRGACDTKGSLAAMLVALGTLARAKQRPSQTEIVLAALVDEEDGQSGSRALVKAGLRANLAIVGEPTRLRIVTAHKGSLWLEIATRGRAAHGATPELGHNAVHRMAEVVRWLHTTYAQWLRRRRHPLLGVATVSVGAIRGGIQANIVPDHCVAHVDRRSLPGESEASVCREIKGRLRQRGLRVTARDSKPAACPPLETNPRLPLIRQLMSIVGQERPEGVHFFCDAAVLAQAGTPSVVFGPGSIAQAHTAQEWLSVRALERAVWILTRFLQSLP
jgi:acetylornithine deacetylase/succinyl-diaminopimelate desuccinylase family protein